MFKILEDKHCVENWSYENDFEKEKTTLGMIALTFFYFLFQVLHSSCKCRAQLLQLLTGVCKRNKRKNSLKIII